MPHPNATVAAGSGALVGPIIYLASLAHVTLDAYAAGYIAVALASLALLVGRDGVKGLIRAVWKGKAQPKA